MADSNGRNIMVQGRLVFTVGDLFQGRIKTVFGTQTPVVNEKGEQVREYGFGLAVEKPNPNHPDRAHYERTLANFNAIWTAIHEEAYALYPSRQIPPAFAMKYKDGDGVDHNGVPYSQREGYAGHLVFAMTTQIPIKFFKFENGQNILVNEGIKCGDYVNVQVTVKAHTAQGQGKSGLYLNPMAVQLIGYGKEIVNAPSGDQIFGTQAPPVPPGASQTPIAPQTGMLVPSAPQMPSFAQTQAPQPMAQPVPQAPAAPPQPHYGVLPQQHQPQQQYAPPAPPQMPAPGNGYAAPAVPQNGQSMSTPQVPGQVAPPVYGSAPPAYPTSPQMPAPPQQQYAPQAPQGYPQQGMPAMPGVPNGYPQR